MADFTTLDLFSGIGGFALTAERAGGQTIAFAETDKNASKLLAERWPATPNLGDVIGICRSGRDCISTDHFIDQLGFPDLVTFGFPCQDLSVAGKRSGLSGQRSGLFYQATRIINELRPSWALWENVPGLLSSDNGRDFARVLLEMDRIGYSGAWRVLDAQWFGVAQRRRRVFGMFSRLDSGAARCSEILSLPESVRGHPAPRRKPWQNASASTEGGLGEGGSKAGTDAIRTERPGSTPEVGKTLKANASGIDPEVTYIPTVAGCIQERDAKGADSDTKPGHLIPVQQRVRRLTPVERERIQGFPDGWTACLSDSARYRTLGNSVAVPVVEWILKRLAQSL